MFVVYAQQQQKHIERKRKIKKFPIPHEQHLVTFISSVLWMFMYLNKYVQARVAEVISKL